MTLLKFWSTAKIRQFFLISWSNNLIKRLNYLKLSINWFDQVKFDQVTPCLLIYSITYVFEKFLVFLWYNFTYYVYCFRFSFLMIVFQACDRIYRVGQKREVTIHKFLCDDTVESRILQLQVTLVQFFLL
jgi:hypothetical protein